MGQKWPRGTKWKGPSKKDAQRLREAAFAELGHMARYEYIGALRLHLTDHKQAKIVADFVAWFNSRS